ncbi:MAG: FAD-dependent oxidoreductase [Bacteroidota bacterium]|nr:FAD-dependent oxidoreductase [Bacteroidota bacterium]
MKKEEIYDQIVYGGSPAAIIYALIKKKQGEKVLLINNFGFLGGSITSGLNCYQEISKNKREGYYSEFHNAIEKSSNGFLFNENNKVIINPEEMKMQSLKILQKYEIDMLFHVNPADYKYTSDQMIELDLIAKEGMLKILCHKLIDASENLLIMKIKRRQYLRAIYNRVNIFITPPLKVSFDKNIEIINSIKLNDGRYWISLDSSKDNIQGENVDDIIERFNLSLKYSGARIQLIPIEKYTYMEQNLSHAEEEANIKTLNEILGRNYLATEQLKRAEETENYFIQKS